MKEINVLKDGRSLQKKRTSLIRKREKQCDFTGLDNVSKSRTGIKTQIVTMLPFVL